MKNSSTEKLELLIKAFETILCALKWEQAKNIRNWSFDATIELLEYSINKLKILSFNDFGCLDNE